MSWLSALGFDTKREKMSDEEMHICGYTARSDKGEKVGRVEDYVVDGENRLRYIVVSTGLWGLNKSVTVPVGMLQIDDQRQEVTVNGLTKQQVEAMPEYDPTVGFTDEYEREVMDVYEPSQRPSVTGTGRIDYERSEKFRMPERMQLLEERLQIAKRAELEGKVTIGKHVETYQESVDVPVTQERLVIEHRPASSETMAEKDMTLHDESITVPLYKEEVEVTKRPVVAEEVVIRKEKETETRTVRETVGREKLDVEDPNKLVADRGREAGQREPKEEVEPPKNRVTGKKVDQEDI